MTRLPWAVRGARLHEPRDLHIAYVVGRMGVATSIDTWPLWYGSPHTARMGFHRLVVLGLLRAFPRPEVSHPAWFTLHPDARSWVADRMDCDEDDLRVTSGIARANLQAVRARNRLWVATVMACRRSAETKLVLFRPEWELRRASAGESVVPDAQLVLASGTGNEVREVAWFVELDAGTERLAVWREKADAYAERKRLGPLYDERSWRLLVVAPSARRARSVAAACAERGFGDKTFLGVGTDLDTDALAHRLWRADELAAAATARPRWCLKGTQNPIDEPDQRP